MAAERPAAVHHFGVASDHRGEQGRDVGRGVLQIGVAHDHVVAGRDPRRGADRGTLALVTVVQFEDDARVRGDRRVQVPGPVGAAVIER